MVSFLTFVLVRFFTLPLCLDRMTCFGDFPSAFVTTAAVSFVTLWGSSGFGGLLGFWKKLMHY